MSTQTVSDLHSTGMLLLLMMMMMKLPILPCAGKLHLQTLNISLNM